MATALLLATSGCTIPSVDDIFASGGADSAGGAGGVGGSDGGSTSVGGSTSSVGGGSTSSVGGGTTSSTTGGGGTTMTGPEDCTDGVDNDGDGDADCADSECTPGFECIADTPAGWQGLYEIAVVNYPDNLPLCEGGKDPTVHYVNPAGPAECTACSCNALQGGACSPPTFMCWAGSQSCSGTGTNLTNLLSSGQCQKPGNIVGFGQSLSCMITAPAQPSGMASCTPSAVDFPNKEPWEKSLGSCDIPAGGGCGASEACVPKSPAGPRCIQKEGNHECPAGPYALKRLVFTDYTDTRSCSDCTCGAGAVTCNGGSYTVFDADQCQLGGNENPAVIDAPQVCDNVTSLLDLGTWSMQATLPQAQGSCPAGGGVPQGSFEPLGAVTFCCIP